MTAPADLLHEPQKLDAASSRPCLGCGHAVPHDRDECGATHFFCSHVTFTKESCENPHKRYSAKCAERADAFSSCWISQEPCDCSEEDRVIADLYAHIATLNSAITKAVLGSIL